MIVWSGGCDSTLVLYDALVEAKRLAKINSWNWPVVTISIAHVGMSAIAEQRSARQAIVTDLKSRGFRWKHIEIDVTARGDEPKAWATGLCQPQLWIATASAFLGKSEPLIMGWHDGDHAWAHMAEIQRLFDAVQSLAARDGKLQTPLRYETKAKIIAHLKKADLYRHVWWCEYSDDPKRANGKPCDVKRDAKACLPCRTHATALYQLATFAKHQATPARRPSRL